MFGEKLDYRALGYKKLGELMRDVPGVESQPNPAYMLRCIDGGPLSPQQHTSPHLNIAPIRPSTIGGSSTFRLLKADGTRIEVPLLKSPRGDRTVGGLKKYVEEHHGIAAIDQQWLLVSERQEPLKDDHKVLDYIRAGDEVQLMVELTLNGKVLALVPRLLANDRTLTELELTKKGIRTVDMDNLSYALKVNSTVATVNLSISHTHISPFLRTTCTFFFKTFFLG